MLLSTFRLCLVGTMLCAGSSLVAGDNATPSPFPDTAQAGEYGNDPQKPVSVALDDPPRSSELAKEPDSHDVTPATRVAANSGARMSADLLRQHLQERLHASKPAAGGDDPLSITVREEVWSFGNGRPSGTMQMEPRTQTVSHVTNDQPPASPAPDVDYCLPIVEHRAGFFGDLLFLRPANAAVTYAVEQNGAGPGASPTGPVGDVELDFQAGFRAGVNRLSGPAASWRATFTYLQLDDTNNLAAANGNVLASRVVHPSTPNSSATSLSASADYEIGFQLIDVDYRHIWCAADWYQVNWLAGVRYGHLDQAFVARQEINGLTTVQTDVEFNGAGIRLGLDGEVGLGHQPISLYGAGIASFLLGETNAHFQQTNQFGGAAVIASRHQDFRITPILDLELGVAWRSPAERWRAALGCQTSAWLNTVTTSEYIRGVQAGSFDNLGETLAFGGFVLRVEWLR